MINESIYNELRLGIQSLEKNIKKFPTGSCEIIALEVLKDTRVQAAFVDLISQEYDFDRVSCKAFGLDQTKVTFGFRCRPPKICFLHPNFTVTYDLSSHQVVGDIEHFP